MVVDHAAIPRIFAEELSKKGEKGFQCCLENAGDVPKLINISNHLYKIRNSSNNSTDKHPKKLDDINLDKDQYKNTMIISDIYYMTLGMIL